MKITKKKTFVTIIVPCRNEEKRIKTCLDSIIVNDYSKSSIEVLVIDGMSEDGTREIIEGYCVQYPYVRLLNNPCKSIPCALNIGLKQSKGEIIIRMDAHSEYPPYFVSKALEVLDMTGADVVGGPIKTMPGADTRVAKSIAMVTSHPFGVGNSKFRTSAKEGYVDTVPFGAYRREVFDKVGLFDERLSRNQDNEFHSRLIEAGGRIYLTPELTACYYNQSTICGLVRQAFRTGAWNVLTVELHLAAFHWRHFVPFVFVTILLTNAILAVFSPWAKIAFFTSIVLYSCAAIISSVQIGFKEGLIYSWTLPSFFFLYHICYGLGTYFGLMRYAINSFDKTTIGSENESYANNVDQ